MAQQSLILNCSAVQLLDYSTELVSLAKFQAATKRNQDEDPDALSWYRRINDYGTLMQFNLKTRGNLARPAPGEERWKESWFLVLINLWRDAVPLMFQQLKECYVEFTKIPGCEEFIYNVEELIDSYVESGLPNDLNLFVTQTFWKRIQVMSVIPYLTV